METCQKILTTHASAFKVKRYPTYGGMAQKLGGRHYLQAVKKVTIMSMSFTAQCQHWMGRQNGNCALTYKCIRMFYTALDLLRDTTILY